MSVPVPSWWLDWHRHCAHSWSCPTRAVCVGDEDAPARRHLRPRPPHTPPAGTRPAHTAATRDQNACKDLDAICYPRAADRVSSMHTPSRGRPAPPTDRASPFPEVTDPFCRLPLVAFIRLTRGYAPWRPAAVIGTDCAKEKYVPWLFTDCRLGTGRVVATRSSRPRPLHLRITRFRRHKRC